MLGVVEGIHHHFYPYHLRRNVDVRKILNKNSFPFELMSINPTSSITSFEVDELAILSNHLCRGKAEAR